MHVKTTISVIEMKETAESQQVLGSDDRSDVDMPDAETGDYFSIYSFHLRYVLLIVVLLHGFKLEVIGPGREIYLR